MESLMLYLLCNFRVWRILKLIKISLVIYISTPILYLFYGTKSCMAIPLNTIENASNVLACSMLREQAETKIILHLLHRGISVVWTRYPLEQPK